MDYKIKDYRKDTAYKEAIKRLDVATKEIEAAYNGKVIVKYVLRKGYFHIDVIPVSTLDQHAFLSFIGKTYEIVNKVFASEGGDDYSFDSMMLQAVQRVSKSMTGQAASNATALLAALTGPNGITNKASKKYKAKHFFVLDRNDVCIETFKPGADEQFTLEPCIPEDFDWTTAFIRIPDE